MTTLCSEPLAFRVPQSEFANFLSTSSIPRHDLRQRLPRLCITCLPTQTVSFLEAGTDHLFYLSTWLSASNGTA